MAKHVGSRSRPRLFGLPRGLAWGIGAFIVVNIVTLVVVVQGLAARSPVDVLMTTAHGTDPVTTDSRPAARTGRASHHHTTAQQDRRVTKGPSKQPSSTRGPSVSRHADRPRLDPYRVGAVTSLSLKPAVALARKAAALSPASSSFLISSSNVLGSQHTAGPGGFGPGTVRAGMTASLLTSRGVDVGGMQEVQSDQLGVFLNRMPGYSFWPAAALGNNGERLQIFWDASRFTRVDQGSVTYVFSGQHIPLPYVLLRDNSSGAEFWVITTHNSPGGMEGERDIATGTEIALIHQLMATGRPVLITGDMNEHTEFFCRVAASTGMVAANGGSGAGGCRLPPGPLRVDWIMGGGGASFSGYRQDGAGLGHASDHYYLYATATVSSPWYAP